ncbi:ribonuclease H-like domain-containing protein [Mycena metata]|uniref:3'-5' exonuclease n=1 Tax=Mycena metata TaxID=1033252 RepID=A0AAD7IRP8_9AGAR|nr:ribonuclease H-like domain-containing protein [Mycena metata]
MSSSRFSVKTPSAIVRVLSAFRTGVRIVSNPAADMMVHTGPKNLQPYPKTYKVLYITTEIRADEALRGIIDGAVGLDCEFTQRRPTMDEHYIRESFPTGSAARKAAMLGLQIVELKRYGRFPVAWDHVGLRLVQISRHNVVWVLDLWKIRAYPAELRRILLSPNIKKIGVGLANDILALWDDLRTEAVNLVDAGMMAKLLLAEKYSNTAYGNLSLQTSVADVLGYIVNKDAGVSNWSVDKLSDEQLEYAGLDAIAAETLYHAMVPALETKSAEIGSPIPRG